MLERFPAGRVRERHSVLGASKLHEIVQRLRERSFTGIVALRWPDAEGVLTLEPQGELGAFFEAAGTLLHGPDALQHILRLADRRRAEAEVMELPPQLGPILHRLSGAEVLHRSLSTEFIDLVRLDRRLLAEGFRGLVVVHGPDWWAFLPFPDGDRALYFDREAASERERIRLLGEIANHPAEIDVWVSRAPEAAQAEPQPATGDRWASFRGEEVFLAAANVDPASVRDALGPLAAEVIRLLDGTRSLDEILQAVGRPPGEVEPILLSLQRRRWIYRYIRRRRPGHAGPEARS
jgi:hypothetical protein